MEPRIDTHDHRVIATASKSPVKRVKHKRAGAGGVTSAFNERKANSKLLSVRLIALKAIADLMHYSRAGEIRILSV